ncbi:hypothetical protein DYB26_012575 [Aphanomyces astaci]|uniref:Uncharacterized protein n=1 Tax=Aphanomyces astaci TaxID=112090 RepID=A0A3R6W8J7_APHAT|nr:hypothetical protein DYB26_012575 [Aphanomyces astaci]
MSFKTHHSKTAIWSSKARLKMSAFTFTCSTRQPNLKTDQHFTKHYPELSPTMLNTLFAVISTLFWAHSTRTQLQAHRTQAEPRLWIGKLLCI